MTLSAGSGMVPYKCCSHTASECHKDRRSGTLACKCLKRSRWLVLLRGSVYCQHAGAGVLLLPIPYSFANLSWCTDRCVRCMAVDILSSTDTDAVVTDELEGWRLS